MTVAEFLKPRLGWGSGVISLSQNVLCTSRNQSVSQHRWPQCRKRLYCPVRASRASPTMDQLGTQHRILAVSDCHTDYPENYAWMAALDAQDYGNDILIVAGDLCDELRLLRRSLSHLATVFHQVFYVVGNHELWIRASDMEMGISDSWNKFQRIIDTCAELGVATSPQRIAKTWIAPVHSWHHQEFDSEPDIPGVPPASGLTIADYLACVWPEDIASDTRRGGSLSHGQQCRLLASRFDKTNDTQAWDAMIAERNSCDVISFSHFLPFLELMPEKRFLFYPNLTKAAGSNPLGRRVTTLRPDIHVFGHTHFAWDAFIGASRFVQAPLSSPKERVQRLRTIGFDAVAHQVGCRPVDASWLPIEIYRFNPSEAVDAAFKEHHRDGGHSKQIGDSFLGLTSAPTDSLTAKGEATHGVASVAIDCDDNPPKLGASKATAEVNTQKLKPQALRFGTTPGNLGAHWSDYYATSPRNPADTTLAPWVADMYKRRRSSLGTAK